MGKIKGWKKTSKRGWLLDTKPIGISWGKLNSEFYYSESRMAGKRSSTFLKKFKTQKEAIEFTMKYMRSHPNG